MENNDKIFEKYSKTTHRIGKTASLIVLFMLVFALLMIAMSETLNRMLCKEHII